MPLIDDGDFFKSNITDYGAEAPTAPTKEEIQAPQAEVEQTTPTFKEKAQAFIKLEDTGFAAMKAYTDYKTRPKDDTVDPEFNGVATLLEEHPELSVYAEKFIDTPNRTRYDQLVEDFKFKEEQLDILSQGSTLETIGAGITGALADPLNLVVGLGLISRAGKLMSAVGKGAQGTSTIARILAKSKAAQAIAAPATKGQALARLGIEGAAAGATTSIAREGILQGLSDTRTAQETQFNIMAETALGAALGPLVGVSYGAVAAAKRGFKDALRGKKTVIEVDPEAGTAKVVSDEFPDPIDKTGNMNAPNETVASPHREDINAAKMVSEYDEMSIAYMNEKLVKAMSGGDTFMAPDLRAALGKTVGTRKYGETLYNSGFIRKKNLEGKANRENAQSKIFERDTAVRYKMKAINDLYKVETEKGILKTVGTKSGRQAHAKFMEDVYDAMVDPTAARSAQVKGAAALMREDYDRMGKELIDAGYFEKGDEALIANYMPQKWDKEAIQLNKDEFEDLLYEHFKQFNEDGTIRSTKGLTEEELTALKQKAREDAADASQVLLNEHDNAMKAFAGDIKNEAKARFLNKRMLKFNAAENKKIKKFLERDALRLYHNYMTRANRMVEVKKAAERAGYADFVDLKQEVAANFDNMIAQAKTVKEKRSILENKTKELELLDNMHASMLGVYKQRGAADGVAEFLQQYQFTRVLGGVTLTSLNEIMMAPLKTSLYGTLKNAWIPMLADAATGAKKMSKNQVDHLAGAFSFEMDSALRGLAGVDDIYNVGRQRNKIQRTMDILTETQAAITGINAWTQSTRRIGAHAASGNIIDTLYKYKKNGKLNRVDTTNLAAAGIGKDDYEAILKQLDLHGEDHLTTKLSNIHEWDDAKAVEKFKNAVQRQLEGMTLNPSVESLPFFAQNNQWLKMMFQFKSFLNAATGKIALPTMQKLANRDVNALMGFMLLMGASAMQVKIKDAFYGSDKEYTEEEFLTRVASESGFFGLAGTTALDAYRTLTADWAGRYGADNLEGIVLGPSAGMVGDVADGIVSTTGMIQDDELNAGDLFDTWKQLLPYQNLAWLRGLLTLYNNDEGEE